MGIPFGRFADLPHQQTVICCNDQSFFDALFLFSFSQDEYIQGSVVYWKWKPFAFHATEDSHIQKWLLTGIANHVAKRLINVAAGRVKINAEFWHWMPAKQRTATQNMCCCRIVRMVYHVFFSQIKNKEIAESGWRHVRTAKMFCNASNSCSCFHGPRAARTPAICYTWWKVEQFVNTSNHQTWKGKMVMTDLHSETKHPFILQMWVWWRADRYCGQWGERVRKLSSGFNELLSKRQDSLDLFKWGLSDSHSDAIPSSSCMWSGFSISSPHSQPCSPTPSDF